MEDATRNFFRNVKAFKTKDRPKQFDPMSLFPGKNEEEVAKELASYFNRMSAEFQPLEPKDIPRTHHRKLPTLEPYQVEGRIRAFKKPKSMVKGDIFPVLFDKFATLLAIPLTDIYNEITRTQIWPLVWKQEFVTVIPKCRTPEGMGDLRNISCTMLASKIYESFVLNWLATEVSCKDNQYGGVRGCGVGHLLVDMWDEVLTGLVDARAAIMVTAIDYAKAFNRLSFQHCLEAFARKGASTQIIRLLAIFLSNRTMSARVNVTWSDQLPVHGGVPQGSILGVMLFNVSTDDLEDGETDTRAFIHSSSSDNCLEDSHMSFHSPIIDRSSEDSNAETLSFIHRSSSENGRSDAGTEDSLPWINTSPGVDQRSPDPCQSPRAVPPGADQLGPGPGQSPRALPLNPDAEPFVPRSYVQPFQAEYCPSAARVNITDELLSRLPRMEPCIDPQTAEVLSVTDELMRQQDAEDEARALCPGHHDIRYERQPNHDHGEVLLSSTPINCHRRGRPRIRSSPVRLRGPRLSARDWSFMPGRRNRRRRRNLNRRINYTDEGELHVEEEVNRKRTGLRWKMKPPRNLKFVEDEHGFRQRPPVNGPRKAGQVQARYTIPEHLQASRCEGRI